MRVDACVCARASGASVREASAPAALPMHLHPHGKAIPWRAVGAAVARVAELGGGAGVRRRRARAQQQAGADGAQQHQRL